MTSKIKQKAFQLFEEGWDTETVATAIDVEESEVELLQKEYDVEQGINGLVDNPEQAEELLGAIQEFNRLKQVEMDRIEKDEENKILKSKRAKVLFFKKLVAFLKSHSQGFQWDYAEVILLIKKFKTLQFQIEEVVDHDEDLFQTLFIWDRTKEVIAHLEQLITDNEEGDIIKFNFDENDVLYLQEALQIEDFEDEVEVETEEEQALNGLLEEEFAPKKY